ncbi:hypothetical protein [Sporolactobacillus terrae]|uniref:Uncharacterized protein n=1 Tax=Sporolactobacillus terrae TaxID=269673 RepID=A0A5K7WZD3_9BACL|nr:hypothetical protein [Sporolactobacillus terrae]BBO00032.1 hypothetical protein St703_27360 [Sporolactobacillus terrae]
MSLWKKTVSILMVSALVLGWFGFGSSTLASSNNQAVDNSEDFYQDNSVKTSFQAMSDIASKSSEIKDPLKIQNLKNISKNVISKKVVLNNSNANLDFDNAKALTITQDNKNYTSVTIPITGGQYSFISNLTLIFDSQNKMITYSETLITKNNNNKFVITSYFDGELVQNKVTDVDYVSDSELKKGLDEIHETTKEINQNYQTAGVGKIAACIGAVAGVNAGVAYLIAGTCVASCPTIVPICVACIGGVATMGAADIGAIVACFKL